jgi:hypothetical protein
LIDKNILKQLKKEFEQPYLLKDRNLILAENIILY